MSGELHAWAPLALGFTLGLRHALDVDHVAAVATIATRERGVRRAAAVGVCWARGHTAALGVVGAAMLLLGWSPPATAGRWLEAAVGVVLVTLGVPPLAGLARGFRLHRHVHAHDDVVHVHVHAHRGATATHDHAGAPHEHPHLLRRPRASFGVGALHGLAGSGAVVLLALAAAATPLARWTYLAAFGSGLLAAMTALSVALCLSLRVGGGRAGWADAARVGAGGASVAVGLSLLLSGA